MALVKDPHSGGVKIPKLVQERTCQRILAHANTNYRDMFTQLDIRFRGPLCYVDAFREPDMTPGRPPPGGHFTREQLIEDLRNKPVHLCRLRYFGDEERWSLAFYTYSNEQYTPCVFHSGSFWGTPEEAFDVGATYLQDR